MLTMFGFKVSFLQVSFVTCRETEKHELKSLKNEEMKEGFHSVVQAAVALESSPAVDGAGCGGLDLGQQGAGKAEGWGRWSKQGQL